jgi:hypothetical protein
MGRIYFEEIGMNGYELLKTELLKYFSRSKIDANMPLIERVVQIVAENPDDKIALDIAIRKKAEAKEKDTENSAYYWKLVTKERQLKSKEYDLCVIKDALDAKEQELDERERKLNECETPEAADRLRLAYIYMDNVEITNGYERTAYIKGLADIMGTGRCENE